MDGGGLTDRARARAWWVRTLGFLSPVDDPKVDALAAEFEAVREEAATETMRGAVELIDQRAVAWLEGRPIALDPGHAEGDDPWDLRRGEFTTAEEAERMLVELERAMPLCVASGPKTTALHAARMDEVRAERDRFAAAARPTEALADPIESMDWLTAKAMLDRVVGRAEKTHPLRQFVIAALERIDRLERIARAAGESDALSRLAVRGAAERIIAEKRGGPCRQCGNTRHPDGSRVAWLCASCKAMVCRDCALKIPGRVPAEYYEQTFCSEACWDHAGRPEE